MKHLLARLVPYRMFRSLYFRQAVLLFERISRAPIRRAQIHALCGGLAHRGWQAEVQMRRMMLGSPPSSLNPPFAVRFRRNASVGQRCESRTQEQTKAEPTRVPGLITADAKG